MDVSRCGSFGARFLMVLACALLAVGAAPADERSEMRSWVERLEGGWAGMDNHTPMGRMPFAMLFERDADGAYTSHSARNRETWIRIRFFEEGGRWLLEQTASMEGLGVQSSVLVPAEPRGATRRWVDPDDPQHLAIDVELDASTLTMTVRLRGELHARFELDRVPETALADLRTEMRRSAQLAPEEAPIDDLVGGRTDSPSPAATHADCDSDDASARTAQDATPASPQERVAHLREAVAAAPDEARRHLALAREIMGILQAEPAQGPVYAFELLQALRTAVELDPGLAEAHAGLVGYYLNAPPIAGGSIEKAEEAARALEKLAPDTGRSLLAQVERRRADRGDAP